MPTNYACRCPIFLMFRQLITWSCVISDSLRCRDGSLLFYVGIAFCCLGHFCYVVIEKIYIYNRYSLAYKTTLWPSARQPNNFHRISTAKLFQTCWKYQLSLRNFKQNGKLYAMSYVKWFLVGFFLLLFLSFHDNLTAIRFLYNKGQNYNSKNRKNRK